MEEKIDDIDSKLLELNDVAGVLNDVRYKLVNIHSNDNDSSNSNSNNYTLRYILTHSIEQIGERIRG